LFKKIVNKNSILFITLADLLILGINSLFVVPFLLKILPKEVVNEFSLFLTLSSIFIVIFQFGLISSFSRFFFSEDNLKVEEIDVIKLQLCLALIGIVPVILLNFFLQFSFKIYLASAISSILSFMVSIRLVKLRIDNKIYSHYLLQISFILAYIVLLFTVTFFLRINLNILLLSNLICSLLFTIIILSGTAGFFKRPIFNKLYIKESISLYVLNVCHVVIIRSLPLFIQQKVLNKIEFSQINFALIYSGISFILVSSFNKFILNRIFLNNSEGSDNKIKYYFLLFHIVTSISFGGIFYFYFHFFFPSSFSKIFYYFILFFVSNFIWNLSLIENLNIQKEYKNYVLKNIYLLLILLFAGAIAYMNFYEFSIDYIFDVQILLSVFFFISTYIKGRNVNESINSIASTFIIFIMALIIFMYYVKFI